MSFIVIILPIIKGLGYLLWSHLIFLKIFLFFLINTLNIYLYRKSPSIRNVHIYTYKIKRMFIPLCFIFGYIVVFIMLLTVYKISNIDKTIDLKSIYLNLISSNKLELAINSLLLISILCLVLFIYRALREKFVFEFTKLHIYLYQYQNYFDIVFEILRYLNIPAYKLFNFLRNNFGVASRYSIICNMVVENLGHLIVFTALIYDVLFNMLIITKIYYVFPIAYLYTQAYVYKRFIEARDVLQDINLSNFYYKKHVRKTAEGVFLENAEFYSNADIQSLQNHILRNFAPEGLTQTDILDSKV